MGIFNTFYLLFKNNEGDIVASNKRIEKSTKEVSAVQKKADEETKQLGKSFVNAVEDATRALAAYVSYQGIKSGIINAQEFNRTLTIQSKLWGANADEVAGYGAAVKAAGGSVQELVGWYDQIYKQNAAIGAPTKPLGQLLDQIHDQVKGLTPENAQFIFDKYGISGAGTRKLLSGSDADYQKAIAAGLLLANNTEKGSAAAQKFGESWDNLTTSLTKFWTTVNTYILPALSKLFDAASEVFSYLGENGGAALGFLAAFALAAPAFLAGALKIATGFSSIGAAAYAAMVPLAKFAALLAVAAAVPDLAVKGGQGIGHWANRMLGRGDANGVLGGGAVTGGSSKSSMDFWLSKGYSPAQAAGLAANERHESGGNASARGDGGLAVGLFQWHPDRVAAILKGTGIDVRTAGRDEQLKAAAWEMQNMGLSDQLKSINNPGQAAAFVSHRYERPANGDYQAMARARTAMEIAGSTPYAAQGGGSRGDTSVHIGELNVHTQATDASGIANGISDELKSHIRSVFAQNNDAVAY